MRAVVEPSASELAPQDRVHDCVTNDVREFLGATHGKLHAGIGVAAAEERNVEQFMTSTASIAFGAIMM